MSNIQQAPNFSYRLRPEDKLFFLHIYKTAGSTLSNLLERRFKREEICPAHQLGPLDQLPRPDLRRYRLYWGHLGFKLAELVPDPMIYITMLRDPVEHVLSIYHAVRRHPEHPLHGRVNRLGMTLADFLRDDQTAIIARDQQVYALTLWHLVWSDERVSRLAQGALTEADFQAMREDAAERFRRAPGRDLLDLARRRLDQFAFVGLVERMEGS